MFVYDACPNHSGLHGRVRCSFSIRQNNNNNRKVMVLHNPSLTVGYASKGHTVTRYAHMKWFLGGDLCVPSQKNVKCKGPTSSSSSTSFFFQVDQDRKKNEGERKGRKRAGRCCVCVCVLSVIEHITGGPEASSSSSSWCVFIFLWKETCFISWQAQHLTRGSGGGGDHVLIGCLGLVLSV